MKFSQKMPLYFFYTMVQKSQKRPKTQIKGGPACSLSPVSVPSLQMTALPTLPEKTHSWPAVNFPLT